MGCDYYILKFLHVVYVDCEDYIQVKKERGYFMDDSDDDDYQRHQLIVRYQPHMLFQNGVWKSDTFEQKYGKFINNDKVLVSVTKKEERQLRE